MNLLTYLLYLVVSLTNGSLYRSLLTVHIVSDAVMCKKRPHGLREVDTQNVDTKALHCHLTEDRPAPTKLSATLHSSKAININLCIFSRHDCRIVTWRLLCACSQSRQTLLFYWWQLAVL